MKKKIALILCLFCLVIPLGCGDGMNPDVATVCLFLDDCWMNQYDEALPVLLEYGYPATFGVITDHIGTGYGIWEYMGEAEIREVADSGMEIACHTATHPDLTTLTYEQLHDEIVASKIFLEAMGFEVKTLVYPYYTWDERTIKYADEAGYLCARAGWQQERYFHLPLSDEDAAYHLPSIQITDQDITTFQSYFDGLGAGDVICLVYHFVADDGPENTSTTLADFRAQMDYIQEAGFNVATLSDLLS